MRRSSCKIRGDNLNRIKANNLLRAGLPRYWKRNQYPKKKKKRFEDQERETTHRHLKARLAAIQRANHVGGGNGMGQRVHKEDVMAPQIHGKAFSGVEGRVSPEASVRAKIIAKFDKFRERQHYALVSRKPLRVSSMWKRERMISGSYSRALLADSTMCCRPLVFSLLQRRP
jgi:hypothetical protein